MWPGSVALFYVQSVNLSKHVPDTFDCATSARQRRYNLLNHHVWRDVNTATGNSIFRCTASRQSPVQDITFCSRSMSMKKQLC